MKRKQELYAYESCDRDIDSVFLRQHDIANFFGRVKIANGFEWQ